MKACIPCTLACSIPQFVIWVLIVLVRDACCMFNVVFHVLLHFTMQFQIFGVGALLAAGKVHACFYHPIETFCYIFADVNGRCSGDPDLFVEYYIFAGKVFLHNTKCCSRCLTYVIQKQYQVHTSTSNIKRMSSVAWQHSIHTKSTILYSSAFTVW